MRQPDYLGNIGRGPRLVSAVLLGIFAALFSVMTVSNAFAIVFLMARGEWDIVPILAASTAFAGVLATLLIWMVRRLLRPPGATGITFPLWFIQVVGCALLPIAAYSSYLALTEGAGQFLRTIPLMLGPPIAMILVPWLVRRRARRMAAAAPLPANPPI